MTGRMNDEGRKGKERNMEEGRKEERKARGRDEQNGNDGR